MIRISPLAFLSLEAEWHQVYTSRRQIPIWPGRTDRVSLLGSIKSDTSRVLRSGAFVPRRNPWSICWALGNTLNLGSDLSSASKVDIIRGLPERQGSLLLATGKQLWLHLLMPSIPVAEQGKLRTDSRGICRVLDQLFWIDSIYACQYGSHQPTWLLSEMWSVQPRNGVFNFS